MEKQKGKGPEWVEKFCVERERVSGCIEKCTYIYGGEYGYISFCMPYPGIWLWVNDIYLHQMPVECVTDYHFVKLNYCMEGRAEVLLKDDRYVYLEDGMLSVDSNESKDSFLYPGGRYLGVELLIDMDRMKNKVPEAFRDLGLDMADLEKRLGADNGSYLATVSREWKETAEQAAKLLKSGGGRPENFRYLTLKLLYLLFQGASRSVDKRCYLTKGQRMIATRAEEKLSRELSRRYTVKELAEEYHVSPSSLKKYFEQVYGMPVSEYMRNLRMRRACELLCARKDSIADIAAECGYGNQGKFGSVFKAYTGQTPLEYRRLHMGRSEKNETADGCACRGEGQDTVYGG